MLSACVLSVKSVSVIQNNSSKYVKNRRKKKLKKKILRIKILDSNSLWDEKREIPEGSEKMMQ